ncbi:MAG: hypothetical protein K1X44_04675 [Alphaproteobacteria bacterium]|nr:hypothetical protein [Alphaproteobacteria bacterium]
MIKKRLPLIFICLNVILGSIFLNNSVWAQENTASSLTSTVKKTNKKEIRSYEDGSVIEIEKYSIDLKNKKDPKIYAISGIIPSNSIIAKTIKNQMEQGQLIPGNKEKPKEEKKLSYGIFSNYLRKGDITVTFYGSPTNDKIEIYPDKTTAVFYGQLGGYIVTRNNGNMSFYFSNGDGAEQLYEVVNKLTKTKSLFAKISEDTMDNDIKETRDNNSQTDRSKKSDKSGGFWGP